MRNLTRYLLWAFVFTVGWDNVSLPLVGSVSRVFGLAVVAATVLTAAIEGRFRKPDAVVGFAIAFSAWIALSLLWTLSYGNTVVLVITYAQLVASVWVIREVVRTREQVQPLLAALCFGFFVPLISLLNNFRLGARISRFGERYTGAGLNADTVGFLLAIGLPVAWYLLMHRRGIVRAMAVIYFVTAPVGLMLTATRGAFLAGAAGCVIIPLTLPRSLRSYALASALLIIGAFSAAWIVPQASWERILSISSQISEDADLGGRTRLWKAGLQAFPQRPLMGAGAGAFAEAVQPYLPNTKGAAAHSLAIGLLVEGGIVSFGIFAAILAACGWTIFYLPPPHRALWGAIMLAWLVGALSGSPEGMKLTWVLFGLIAAQSGLTRTVSDASPMEQASRTASQSLSPVRI